MSTQPTWNPTRIFDQNEGLKLTSDEIFGIRYNLPRAQDGGFYVDAVFEGGGVKGTAFLGALGGFADAGIRFRKVAGTSAGAITAAVVAAGFTIEETEIMPIILSDQFICTILVFARQPSIPGRLCR